MEEGGDDDEECRCLRARGVISVFKSDLVERVGVLGGLRGGVGCRMVDGPATDIV
jgi:hypothetical protein